MALVACSASHHEGDKAEDEDGHPAVRHHLHSFLRFVMDTLPDSPSARPLWSRAMLRSTGIAEPLI